MGNYSLKKQRDSYFETLRNDIILKSYPKSLHKESFDQFGLGKKLFKEKWDNLFFRIIINILLPLMIFIKNLFDLIYSFYKVISRRRKNKKVFIKKRLFLEHLRLLYNISKRAGLQQEDDVWLQMPSNKYKIPDNYKKITVYDLLNLKEVLLAYCQSLLIHIITVFRYGYKYYLLSLKSFEWCLIDFALRNVDSNIELYYSNVCDRNAILYDKLPHNNKCMIEHGTMFFYHLTIKSPYYTWQEDKGYYIWNSLYKSSPSKVYCLSVNDKIALERSVIANSPEYIIIGYGFEPSYIPKRKSLLIVGNYNLHYDDEVFIVKELQELEIDIFLKNHPTMNDSLYDKLKETSNIKFIEGGSLEYPKVDVLISYDSTLAYEYESIGTKVLFYEDLDLSKIRQTVISLLKLS